MPSLLPYDPKSADSIVEYAQRLISKKFSDVLEDPMVPITPEEVESWNRPGNKGGLGVFLEKYFFGYVPNSRNQADFAEAGLELKTTPYEKRREKLVAGERLELTMIPNNQPIDDDFENSHLWQKCAWLLLIYYFRQRNIKRLDQRIDFVLRWQPSLADLEVIRQDFHYIVQMIRAGKAHELSEADTLYLGACTKGANAASSIRPQYYGTQPARRRAFCYKQSFMTYVLNMEIAKSGAESIFKQKMPQMTFEASLKAKIHPYVGQSEEVLCRKFDLKTSAKNHLSLLVYRMLGLHSSRAAEFEKAGIRVKTIRIETNGRMKESMSFPAFSFKQIAEEEWEQSNLFEQFERAKFFFVIFRKDAGQYRLLGCKLWNMPKKDIEGGLRKCWIDTQKVLQEGVQFSYQGNSIHNNFPGSADNPVAHVRPHASHSYYRLKDGTSIGTKQSDGDQLPDGQWMTKQCFWLNNEYILGQLAPVLTERV